MKPKKIKPPSNQRMTIGVLIVLVIVNAILLMKVEYSGPSIALICYAFVTFLCWRQNDFRAGIAVGIFGFVIHLYELIFQGTKELGTFDLILFFINLLFPIPLIYFSFKAFKEIKHSKKAIKSKRSQIEN